MHRNRGLGLVVAAVVVAILGLPAAAPAADTVRSLSDLGPIPSSSLGPTALAPLKPLVCKAQASGKLEVSLAGTFL